MNEYSEYFIYGSEEHDKKHPEDVKNIPGCIKMGISESTARMIWEKMVKFASYAFNKSHATCYAALGARTAYLACHYPIEYTTGILNSFLGNNDKISYYVEKCKKKGISLLPPDVNMSGSEFRVVIEDEKKKIIFGLSGIKCVGSVAANAIINERKENGPYKSLEDFLVRTSGSKVNKRAIEALIYTGAFDSFSCGNRAELIDAIPDMLNIIAAYKKKNKNQLSLFGDIFGDENAEYSLSIRKRKDFSGSVIAEKEKEFLGYFIKHPIKEYSQKLDLWKSKGFLQDISVVIQEVDDSLQKKVYRKRICGLVQEIKSFTYYDRNSKRNVQGMNFILTDETASVRCVAFSDIVTKYGYLLKDMAIVYVLCDIKTDDFGTSATIKDIHIFSGDEKNA